MFQSNQGDAIGHFIYSSLQDQIWVWIFFMLTHIKKEKEKKKQEKKKSERKEWRNSM